jgi:hypothetical protein
MTVGFGMSIGTVNSAWAATTADRERPSVRVRRTAVTFDSAGGARVGGLPRFAPVVTDFADLTREVEPVVLGGRIWTSVDLVAAVAIYLIDAVEPEGEPVITYPACYSDRPIHRLRHALDWAGAAGTLLMPEPVAAVEWLDAEYGVSDNGVTLVYDLGGNSLDVAVVRTDADRDERGVLGRALRSHEYGGRPLGAILARYARALSPGVPSPVSKVVPTVDTIRLRTWNVRNSLRLVRRCVHGAGLSLRDIDRVLLVGGAARPVEVARVLDELGRPVVMSPDPAHTVAVGAALASARPADTGTGLGKYPRGAAVLSSAAVASALAMSAATVLGSGPIGGDDPALELAPALAGPADNHTAVPELHDAAAEVVPPGTQLASYSAPVSYTTAGQHTSVAAVAEMESFTGTHGHGKYCAPSDRVEPLTYANPAQFTNPLPFVTTPPLLSLTPISGIIPSVSLPSTLQNTNPFGVQQSSNARTPAATAAGNSLPDASAADTASSPPAASNISSADPAGTSGRTSPSSGTSGSMADSTGTAANSSSGTLSGASEPGTPRPVPGNGTTSPGANPGGISSGETTSSGPAAGDSTSAVGAGTSTAASGASAGGAAVGGSFASASQAGSSHAGSAAGSSHAGSSDGGSHSGGHH